MTGHLSKIFLCALTVWFFLTASLLYTFILPKPQQYARAGLAVVDAPQNVLTTILTAIQNAFNAISKVYQEYISKATVWLQKDGLLQNALKVAWHTARRKLLDMLVNDIIGWIQGGGTPRFVTDFPGELAAAADAGAGAFANKLAGVNLCSDFRININAAFPAVPRPFEQRVACTASDIYDNFDRIWDNTFARGGWENWLALQQPQNNIFGAYLLAQGELASEIAQKTEARKLQIGSGNGFVDVEECGEWSMLDDQGRPTGDRITKNYSTGRLTPDNTSTPGRVCEDLPLHPDEFAPTADERGVSAGKPKKVLCYNVNQQTGQREPGSEEEYYEGAHLRCTKKQSLTPGTLVARSAADALNVDIPWLINAEEVTAYLALIINAVINRVAREGVALVKHGAGSQTAASAGYSSGGFDCSRITNPELRTQYCGYGSPSNPYIRQTAQDPIQIIKSELPLLANIKIDLQNFLKDLRKARETLERLRDAQSMVRDAEQGIISSIARIVGAPHDVGSPIINRDADAFPLPMPPQASACTWDSSDRVARAPNQAQQSDNTIGETFSITARGIAAIAHIDAISSIGSATVTRTSAYTETSNSTTACTEGRWSTSHSVTDSAVEITGKLNETIERIARLEEAQRIVEALIRDIGYTDGPPDNDYREVLEKWNRNLGIQTGLIIGEDEDRNGNGRSDFEDALEAITAIRSRIVGNGPDGGAGFQGLMRSSEPELSNLTSEFIDYHTQTTSQIADAELKTGSAFTPEAGGYYGQLAKLQEIAGALNTALTACINPLQRSLACSSQE